MYTYTLHSEITNHFHTFTNTHLCKKPPLICDHFPRIPILVTIKSLWSEHGSSRTIASPDLTPAQYWINKKMVYNRPSADRAIFSLCWLRKLAPVFHEIKRGAKPRLTSSYTFPPICVSNINFVRILIASFDCLRPLCLSTVIILVLVFRHSNIENSSMIIDLFLTALIRTFYFSYPMFLRDYI